MSIASRIGLCFGERAIPFPKKYRYRATAVIARDHVWVAVAVKVAHSDCMSVAEGIVFYGLAKATASVIQKNKQVSRYFDRFETGAYYVYVAIPVEVCSRDLDACQAGIERGGFERSVALAKQHRQF